MKICKKSQAKPDRIAIAYRLRLDIHAYIKANEGCTIRAIIDAFPDRNIETVRKSVYRLRIADEIVTNEVPGMAGRHICRTLTAEIKPESATRDRLSMPKKTIKNPSDKTGLVYAKIKPESATRKRLSMPKKPSARYSSRSGEKNSGLVYSKDGGRVMTEEKITMIDPQRPWRTVHRGSMRERNLPGQRGQGACQS
jgi:hypothetical protein